MEDETEELDSTGLPQDEKERILSMVMDQMDSSNDGYEFLCERIKEELDFKSGDQWTEEDKNLRDGRPCLVIDKMSKYLDKIEGYYRNNPPQANVKSRFNATENDAKVVKGYLRSFMASPKSKACVQTACGHMASVGYGWIYVSYAKDSVRSFDEYSPVMVRVDDPRSVRFDNASVEADGSDATWCSLLRTMPKKQAEKDFKDLVSDFESIPDDYRDQWLKDDQIVVADYWWIEDVDDVLTEVKMLIDGTKKRLWAHELEKRGEGTYQVLRSAKMQRKTVKMVTVTGAGIVHYQDWPGTNLPLIPCYGAQVWSDGRKFYSGMVRRMMDPQRLVNYYSSTSAEVTALSPRVPWVMAEQQVEGHEEEWDTSTTENYARLTYKHIEGIPQPQRATQSPDVAPLLGAISGSTADLADVSGIYEASLGQEAGQKSGIAIENASLNSDQVLAILIDNGRRSVIRATQVAVDMLPFLVTDERTIRYMSEEGEEFEITVNTETPTEAQGVKGLEPVAIDLATAVFEVVVEEGASYQTRKQESAKGGLDLIGLLPESQRGAVAAEVVRNLPWPNAKKLSKILSSTLPPEIRAVVDGDDNSKEDPQAMAIMQGLKSEIEQGDAELAQKDAELNDLRGILQQLQMAVLSTAQDNETKLQIAAMKNATDLEIAQIEAGTTREKTAAELRMDLVISEMDQRAKKNAKQMDAALKLAEKYLGGSSVGPIGNIAGQLRGVP